MISPAIHFSGGICKEAIDFYERVFKGTNKFIDYDKDAPADSGITVTENTKDHVMHAGLTICGTQINFSDTNESVDPGNMICLNVFFKNETEVCEAYEGLREGGKIIVELGPQFFSPMYGSIVDKYGVKWQLISEG